MLPDSANWCRTDRMNHPFRPAQAIRFILSLAMSLFILACDGNRPFRDASPVPETFSFFDVGPNTVQNDALLALLRNRLGRESISRRNLIDLEESLPKGFLQAHFPALHQLNTQLNGQSGIRIEHQTARLMYRYPDKAQTPFDTVALLFSEFTGLPLVCHIQARDEHQAILESLEKRHGTPRIFPGKDSDHRIYGWEKHEDVMILSAFVNPAGRPVYDITIYYVHRLRELLDMESHDPGQEGRSVNKTFSTARPMDMMPPMESTGNPRVRFGPG